MNEFLSEIMNGNAALAAVSLAVICTIYLAHETVALKVWGYLWRGRLSRGMRVAVAVMTLSVGIGLRSAEVMRWRMVGGEPRLFWLTLGSIIATLGFLCCIREISKPLYGDGPWIWTLVTMTIYTACISVVRFL